MKKISLRAFFMTPILMLFACPLFALPVSGNGKITETERNVRGFTGIDISGSTELIIQKGSSWQVLVSMDSNLQEHFIAEVKGNTLHLHFKSGTSITRLTECKVTVTMPEISRISSSGAGKIMMLPGFSGDSFELTTSGSSDFIGEIYYTRSKFSLSGSSSIKLRGDSSSTQISCSGAGNIEAADYVVDNATISISGAGNARITVEEYLDATVSGAGSITYYGSPRVNQRVTGIGKVKQG